jgi:hypothetical protein
MDPITSPSIENFLADTTSGHTIVAELEQALEHGRRVLVWGPRVGAVELTEDLLELWNAEKAPIVGVNAGAQCTRTREGTSDSGWVSWLRSTSSSLLRYALKRAPAGIVLTFANDDAKEGLEEVFATQVGFVTAVAAEDAAGALARFTKISPVAAAKLDLLVGLEQQGEATFIADVRRVVGGGLEAFAVLQAGKYVHPKAA